MARKLIIVAETKTAGEVAFPSATVIVTPKTGGAPARGMTGAKVLVMDAMRDHEKLDELLREIQPATPELLTGWKNQVETVQSLAPKRLDK